MKGNSQEWFDGEILQSIALRDKVFRKYKRRKWNVDKKIYDEARNKSHRLILLKKRKYFENKLKQNIAKPKDLWKTLKLLGLSKNVSVVQKNAIYSNLAESLLKILPNSPNKFDMNSVANITKKITKR